MLVRTPLKDRARGRWHGILLALGMPSKYLTGKKGPCPFCGGKDRWRFTDFNGDGLWICNQCDRGDGIDLVMKFLGLPFKEAAERIEAVMGEAKVQLPPKRDEAKARADLNRLWHSG